MEAGNKRIGRKWKEIKERAEESKRKKDFIF